MINANESTKTKDVQYLKDFLRFRIPTLVKKFNNRPGDKNSLFCDFITLNNVIKSFNIPLKYSSKDTLTDMYDEFKNKDNLFDLNKFCIQICSVKENNDFAHLQEKYPGKLYQKIKEDTHNLSVQLENNESLIKAEEKCLLEKDNVYEDIRLRKASEEKSDKIDTNSIRNCQPNKEFMLHSYANKEIYRKKHDDIVLLFEPPDDLIIKSMFFK